MSELVDIVHKIYRGGGYRISRARGRVEDYLGCAHCRGEGQEATLWPYHGFVRGQCCVCRGRGFFPVPAEGERLPEACGR